MPHAYGLHVEVVAPCLCCRAPRVFVFASPSDQVVCANCVNHLGSDKSERRDAEHVAMWSDLYADLRINHQAEVERFSAEIETDAATIVQLRAEVVELIAVAAGDFTAKPTGGVRRLLETEVLQRAGRATELLQRRIDRLMAALWKIEALHHDAEGKIGYCTCGKLLANCGESLALEPERQSLGEWERKNVGLARDGDRHALPPEHPALGTGRPHKPQRR